MSMIAPAVGRCVRTRHGLVIGAYDRDRDTVRMRGDELFDVDNIRALSSIPFTFSCTQDVPHLLLHRSVMALPLRGDTDHRTVLRVRATGAYPTRTSAL